MKYFIMVRGNFLHSRTFPDELQVIRLEKKELLPCPVFQTNFRPRITKEVKKFRSIFKSFQYTYIFLS